MKLKELKKKVYDLAEVRNTKQLKAKYAEFKTLDMRLKVSWQKVLDSLKKTNNNFEAWLNDPPEEYKEIFSEVKKSSEAFEQSSSKTKKLVQNLESIASSLEVTAEELQDEATHLDKQNKLASELNKQARLN